jgi:hypothetical protein
MSGLSTNKEYDDDDDDAFWNIALMHHDVSSSIRTEKNHNPGDDSIDHDDDDDNQNSDDAVMRSRTISYRLPIMAGDYGDADDDNNSSSDPTSSMTKAITLHLSPLPCSQGIFSPLGAQAWYGSALLSSFLLQQIPYHAQQQHPDGSDSSILTRQPRSGISNNTSGAGRRIQEHLARFDQNRTITALELGSGAVGLGGLSLACMLAFVSVDNNKNDSSSCQEQQRHCVILTDHEPCIVQHLKRNVEANQERLQQQFGEIAPMKKSTCMATRLPCLPQIHVETLDWNDLAERGDSHPLISLLENRRGNRMGSEHENNVDDEIGNVVADAHDSAFGDPLQQQGQKTCPKDESHDRVDALQLVVGSELVYTPETARACAKSVTFLLERYPRLLVLIIQVIHRDGWSNAFLPLLRDQTNFVIHEECIPVDCDTMARDLIPTGGTLDRFDFGACYIYRSDATTSYFCDP